MAIISHITVLGHYFLDVLPGTPSGTGGKAINDNFKTLSDSVDLLKYKIEIGNLMIGGGTETVSSPVGAASFGTLKATSGKTATITTNTIGTGILSAGYVYANTFDATIGATGIGAVSFGKAVGTGAIASIGSSGAGSFAGGSALGGNILAGTGIGSFAFGSATTAGDITASGEGSFAIGKATSAITASAANSFQFGPGVNATPSSLQVGSNSMLVNDGQFVGKALKMSTTAVGVGTNPFSVLQTGFNHLVTTAASTIICNLPAASACGDGKMFVFTKIDSGVGKISITPNGTDKIQGVNAAFDITAQWGSIMLVTDGFDWTIAPGTASSVTPAGIMPTGVQYQHIEFNSLNVPVAQNGLNMIGDINPTTDNTRSIGTLGANAAADRRFATINTNRLNATHKSGAGGTETITSLSNGSIVMGVVQASGDSPAIIYGGNSSGNFAGGVAVNTYDNAAYPSKISVANSATGAFVFGKTFVDHDANASIFAVGSGSMAVGFAQGVNGNALISATGSGSFARGATSGGVISAAQNGATAFGNSTTTYNIEATGIGSFAIGSATADIKATVENSFQFGPGLNGVAGLQVGDAQTRTASGVAVTGVLLRPTAGIDVISTVGLGTKTITHAGKGVSIASVNAATGTTNTITPSSDGSFACATMGNPALTDPGNTSLIVSAPGGFAGGYISNPGTGGTTATISSTGVGASFAHGWCQKGNSLINSSGKGSFANGWAYSDSTIKALGNGSFVNGTAGGSGAKLYAQGNGSFVAGYADWAKGITAAGPGSMAIGFIYGTGSNTAVISTAAASKGSFAGGYSKTTGGTGNNIIRTTTSPGSFAFGNIRVTGAGSGNNITSSGLGSVALGNITATTGSTTQITSQGSGSLAFGCAETAGSIITATGSGSFAGGDTDAGFAITATGHGSFAFGLADTAAIIATPTNSFQIGPGANATATSLQVGDAGIGGTTSQTAGVMLNGTLPNITNIKRFGTGTKTVTITGVGAFAGGSIYAPNYSTGLIEASGNGSLANGYIRATGTGKDLKLRALGAGSFVTGYILGTGGTTSSIYAYEKGSFACGHARQGGIIKSNGWGSFAGGYAYGYATNLVGKITSSHGAFAFGKAKQGEITASGQGSFATGFTFKGNIVSSDEGTFAFGYVATNRTANVTVINSTAKGSFAGGFSTSTTGLNVITAGGLYSGGYGAFAFGSIHSSGTGNSIKATKSGAVAFGAIGEQVATQTGDNNTILASGVGSMAVGAIIDPATSQTITASATNSFQFGPGVNALTSSLQIGNITTGVSAGQSTLGGMALMSKGGIVVTSAAAGAAVTGTQRVGNAVDICGQANIVFGRAAASSANTAIISDCNPLGCLIFGDALILSGGTGNVANISASSGGGAGGGSGGGSGQLSHGVARITAGSSLTSLIKTFSEGSLAGGAAIDGGSITTVGKGSIAHGCAENSNTSIITAVGSGAVALGDTDAGFAITATGHGSLAIGLATAAITASVDNSFQ
ncbi:MAG: hypothetical protein NTW48_08400, partial [Chloroflexi bacterium]|nr:hypothetical protein [Chloroflexota bacterium]